MTQSFGHNWQDINLAGLKSLGKAAQTTNALILDGIATEFDSPLRPHATFPTPDGKINFTLSPAPSSDGASRAIPIMGGLVNSVAQSTLDFQSSGHPTTGATFVMTWPTSDTVSYYRRVGFALDNNGQIIVTFSASFAALGSLPNVGTLISSAHLPIGWVDIQCTDDVNLYYKSADASTDVITNSTIGRFSAGGGAGGGGSLTTYTSVADAMAATGVLDGALCYIPTNKTIYEYKATAYAAVTADSINIITVTADANARWAAVAGKYHYAVPGCVFATTADMTAMTTELDNVLGYCVATETLYRYEATAYSAVTADGTYVLDVTSDANARWIGVAGAYNYAFRSGYPALASSLATIGSSGEIVDMLFKARMVDDLSVTPDGTTPVDIAAGKTDATLYTTSGKFRLNYDASKTLTGTGTAMALSADVTQFTPKAGDVLIFGTEVRRITTWTSYSNFVVEAAFTTDPSTSACCISQAVHTVDLNNFTAGGTGLAVSSQITDDVYSLFVGYSDSETLADIIPDFGTAAKIAYSVSAEGSSWSDLTTRQTSLSNTESATSTPVAGSNLYVRFFANKTTGAGAVNLLSYKVLWMPQVSSSSATGSQLVAYASPLRGIYVNCTHSVVAGKSRLTFTTPYGRGLSSTNPAGSALDVFGNGQKFPLYIASVTDTTQAYFKEMSDTVIELDQDYSLTAVQFLFKTPTAVVDSNTNNTGRIAALESLMPYALPGALNPATQGLTNTTYINPTYINVPYTTIINRAQILDLSNDAGCRAGIERIQIQQIYEIPNEVGPNGEKVFGVIGDKYDQIRFVGDWQIVNDSSGSRPSTVTYTDVTSYVEITFYGTGINLLTLVNTTAANMEIRYTLDGGTESGNIFSGTYSNILTGRNYPQNTIIAVISAQTLGFHTVKLRKANSSGNFMHAYGLEILNEVTATSIQPGTVYGNGGQAVISAATTLPFKPASYVGTTGAYVHNYVNSDGTVGQVFTQAAASPSYLTGSDHTNEELIRTINFREFGCGRTDDFSRLNITPTAVAFTLDDGTTTLVSDSACTATFSSTDAVYPAGVNFITLTFVGTGLDVLAVPSALASFNNVNVYVDNSLAGTLTAPTNTTVRNIKICSGLAYGTHTVKFSRAASGGNSWTYSAFKVYAPKTPTLPANAKLLSKYYVMADYVANTTAGLDTIATGVLRKQLGSRETTFLGTWTNQLAVTGVPGGWQVYTITSSSIAKYTFFGTGFELRSYSNNGNNITVTIDGITPVGVTTSVYGGFNSYSAGVLTGNAGTTGSGFSLSGLSLGVHTVVFTTNNTTQFNIESFDVITPIYFPKIQADGIKQNTLPVGSCSVGDLRKTSLEDTQTKRTTAIATGITSSPTVTSTSYVPVPDMSVSINSPGNWFDLVFNTSAFCTVTSDYVYFVFYVDGVPVLPVMTLQCPLASKPIPTSMNREVYLAEGVHKVDVYWTVSSGATGYAHSTDRILIASEK